MAYQIYPGKQGAAAFAALLEKNAVPFQRRGLQFDLEVQPCLLSLLADYIYGDYCRYHLAQDLQRQVEDLAWQEALQLAAEGLALLTSAPQLFQLPPAYYDVVGDLFRQKPTPAHSGLCNLSFTGIERSLDWRGVFFGRKL